MKTDIEIARQCQMRPIADVASSLGLLEDEIEFYGRYKAKINQTAIDRLGKEKDGKLILVTAINPTPAGEGKTTTTVGLGQAMCSLGKNTVIALREPSLGPVFGVKGGAAGGGYAQVVPMEDINLHFTGDIHAVTAANNLLCALIDNHIHQGNRLQIDPRRVVCKRVLDMNDRALRNVIVGLGGRIDGMPRQDGFMISVASEVMAILCLSEDLMDLKKRLSRMVVAYTYSDQPVTAGDVEAGGAMTVLLKDAISPNLVQTLEGTPCVMHGGPFANIAHGCNSVRATKLALKLGDYCITEAGFGADLGGEKFFDIKCRYANLSPQAVVLVATVRALKYNGHVPIRELKVENAEALKAGLPNLGKHIENIAALGVPCVVALNCFDTDSPGEIACVQEFCKEMGVVCVLSEVFAKGAEGGLALAKEVIALTDRAPVAFRPYYDLFLSLQEKILSIVTKVYGGKGVNYSPSALKTIGEIEAMGYGNLPVCMAKTQYSLSDNPQLLCRPCDFDVSVKEVRLSAGAGFVVVLTGDVMTMPGLPLSPAANAIDIDENGIVSGLF